MSPSCRATTWSPTRRSTTANRCPGRPRSRAGDGRSFVAKDGALCLEVNNKGANAWDAQVRHREMVIQKGHTYSIRFKAYATRPTHAPQGRHGRAALRRVLGRRHRADHEPQTFAGQFTMSGDDDPTAELTFHMGGNLAGPERAFRVCIDDVHLDDPEFVAPRAAAGPPCPKVRVNEVGYFSRRWSSARSSRTPRRTPLEWELLGANGAVVAQGETVFSGPDAASGEAVHLADFSAFKQARRGLPAPGRQATRATRSPSAATSTRSSSTTRSRTSITTAAASRSPCPTRATRSGRGPPGTVGDKSVPCAPGSGCNYSLDVHRGLVRRRRPRQVRGQRRHLGVDAAEPVRARPSTSARRRRTSATASSASPRARTACPTSSTRRAGSSSSCSRCRCPTGNPLAGMVHHKVHDEKWTALGMPPRTTITMKRFLRPPSTAATLNLAAVAAQAARIWKTFDPAFSARCLAAAERAWAAAQANPDVYAPPTTTRGGGPYDDTRRHRRVLLGGGRALRHHRQGAVQGVRPASPHFKVIPASRRQRTAARRPAMTWQATEALGTISARRGAERPRRGGGRPRSGRASSRRRTSYLDVDRDAGLPRSRSSRRRGASTPGAPTRSCSTT